MAESATSVGSFTFLGVFAMFSLCPLTFTRYASDESCVGPPQARSRKMPLNGRSTRIPRLVRYNQNILLAERCE